MAGLKRWLLENGRQGEASHMDLTGGRYTLPAELEKTFYAKMANRMGKGETFHMIERRTPVFRMFADLDWRAAEPVDDGLQQQIASFVAQQAFLIWQLTGETRVIVCKRVQVQEASGLWKGGLHIHWPSILTGADAALTFRHVAAERCGDHFGERALGDEWGKVIDDHVYRGCGLRMVHNMKKSAEDVYRPAFELVMSFEDEGGLQKPVARVADIAETDDYGRWINVCSIRYHGIAKTDVQPCAASGVTATRAAAVSEESIMPHHSGLEALRAALPRCYSTCRFVRLLRGGGAPDRYFLRTDSRICQNLESSESTPGAHRSNSIYFVIGEAQTYQACFCGCETAEGRLHGPCKHYKSDPVQTPAVLRASLFPLKTATSSCQDIFDHFFKAPEPQRKRRRVQKKS